MANDDTNHWIYAGGLPYELTEGDIICVFSQYGEIADISLSRDKDTGKSRGFCFMKYEDARSCELAIDNFNGVTVLGRKIKVSASSKRPKETSSNSQRQLSPLIRRDPPSNGRLNDNNSSPANERRATYNKTDSPHHQNNFSPSPRHRHKSPHSRQTGDRPTRRDISPSNERATNSNHRERISYRQDRYHRHTERSSPLSRGRSRSHSPRHHPSIRKHSPKRYHSPRRNRSPSIDHTPQRHYSSRHHHSPKRYHSPRRHDSPRRYHSPQRHHTSHRNRSPSSDDRQASSRRSNRGRSPDHLKRSSHHHRHNRSSSRERHRNHKHNSKDTRSIHN